MYLKSHSRVKDGKEHEYFSICEKVVCAGGRGIERQVFYLGEINDSQREGWLKLIEAFDTESQQQPSWRSLPVIGPYRSTPRSLVYRSDCRSSA